MFILMVLVSGVIVSEWLGVTQLKAQYCTLPLYLPISTGTAISVPPPKGGDNPSLIPSIPILQDPEPHPKGKFCLAGQCCYEYVPADTTQYEGINVHGKPSDGGHFVGKYIEFNNYRDIADYVYQPAFTHLTVKPAVFPQLNLQKIAPCLQPGTVIWCTTAFLDKFFRDFYPLIKVPFVLVSGDTDASSPEKHVDRLKDEKLLHWYGQNSDINASQYAKYTAIPLGISQWMNGPATLYEHQEEYLKIPKTKLCIYNSITQAHPDRVAVTKLVQEKMPWVEVWTHQRMGHHLPTVYKRIAEFKFIFSPRGVGIDCYRTWEALLLGTIPIVKSSTMNEAYEDLPILIVDDWNIITPEFLNQKWVEMMESGKKYNWAKLYRPYWQQMFYRHRSPYESKKDKIRYTEN
jgi:hypothetical protein